MESSERGALGLVRLVAICLLFAGIIDAGIYLTQYETPYYEMQRHLPHSDPLPLKVWRLVLDAIPFLAGIIILVKAKALAEWVADLIE
jgi:hypothetical protein